MNSMKNTVDIPHEAGTRVGAIERRTGDDTIEQLSLLPHTEVAVRFRLPAETRQRGLRHIAEIRQVLAARRAARDDAVVHRLPPRTQRAA
jgi:hypothetical protein